jgi:hypothetical protein
LERAIHVGLETGDLEWAGYDSVRATRHQFFLPRFSTFCLSAHCWRKLQFYYCDHLFFSGEALDVVSAAQHAYFQALVGRHQELQATYLNIWRRVVLKLSQENVEESYTFWYRFVCLFLFLFLLFFSKNDLVNSVIIVLYFLGAVVR